MVPLEVQYVEDKFGCTIFFSKVMHFLLVIPVSTCVLVQVSERYSVAILSQVLPLYVMFFFIQP